MSKELRIRKWVELIAAWESYDHDSDEPDDSQIIKAIESIPAEVLASMVTDHSILVDPRAIPNNTEDLKAMKITNPELIDDPGYWVKLQRPRMGWLIKDTSDTEGKRRIENDNRNLHPIFSMPRRVWDKILSTKRFEEIDPWEKQKLLMLYPDECRRGKKGNFEAFKSIADDTLTVDFPSLWHICEPKAQVTADGVPQFLIMAEHTRTVEKSFEVSTIEK